MVKINFHKKGCGKSDVVLYLGITNPSFEYLESILIFRIPNFFLITRWQLQSSTIYIFCPRHDVHRDATPSL
jgi:hypothetical protein